MSNDEAIAQIIGITQKSKESIIEIVEKYSISAEIIYKFYCALARFPTYEEADFIAICGVDNFVKIYFNN